MTWRTFDVCTGSTRTITSGLKTQSAAEGYQWWKFEGKFTPELNSTGNRDGGRKWEPGRLGTGAAGARPGVLRRHWEAALGIRGMIVQAE